MTEEKELYILLKTYKYKLTKQQYLTLKGQLRAGDYAGFRKGLFKIQVRKLAK